LEKWDTLTQVARGIVNDDKEKVALANQLSERATRRLMLKPQDGEMGSDSESLEHVESADSDSRSDRSSYNGGSRDIKTLGDNEKEILEGKKEDNIRIRGNSKTKIKFHHKPSRKCTECKFMG
jgi:hypothetical protein